VYLNREDLFALRSMLNTRLTRLVDTIGNQLQRWLRNPWRRTSLLLLSLLFGNFFATTVSTVAGQQARLDVTIALFALLGTEFIARLSYSRNRTLAKSLLVSLLNSFRLGFIYSMFVEALKLGS